MFELALGSGCGIACSHEVFVNSELIYDALLAICVLGHGIAFEPSPQVLGLGSARCCRTLAEALLPFWSTDMSLDTNFCGVRCSWASCCAIPSREVVSRLLASFPPSSDAVIRARRVPACPSPALHELHAYCPRLRLGHLNQPSALFQAMEEHICYGLKECLIAALSFFAGCFSIHPHFHLEPSAPSLLFPAFCHGRFVSHRCRGFWEVIERWVVLPRRIAVAGRRHGSELSPPELSFALVFCFSYCFSLILSTFYQDQTVLYSVEDESVPEA